MAVVSSAPFWPIILENVPESVKDFAIESDTLSISGDGSVYSEETQIAKAARIEEPERTQWQPILPKSELLATQRVSEDAASIYNVSGWSDGYFEVTDDGHLAVKPQGASGPSLDLYELTNQLSSQGLRTPIILRFPDILGDRIAKLNAAFSSAIHRSGYGASYRGVFPVKCNHDRDIVKAMVEFGRPYGFGLEVGSKAELVMAAAVLAEVGSSAIGTMLICNGYKDAEYTELAMRIGQLGPQVVIVMEQPEEVALAINAARKIPTSSTVLGIRAKLGTVHGGHWASTSGDAAKFGLSSRQIVHAIGQLSTAGVLHRLALLHFHVGSQMSSLGEVRDALSEGSALYAELVKLGAPLKFFDIGGGLAIDYDGSGSEEHTSRAYGLEDYALAVVGAVSQACMARGVAVPTLISESGRALASHHAVVVFDVINPDIAVEDAAPADSDDSTDTTLLQTEEDTAATFTSAAKKSPVSATLSPLQRFTLGETTTNCGSPPTSSSLSSATSTKSSFLISTLYQILDSMSPTVQSLRAAVRDAAYFKDDTLRAFKLGMVTLADRAAVEELVEAIGDRARELAALHGVSLSPHEEDSAAASNGEKVKMVHINLSVFKSAVDCWAIGQVFPILPISRLNERPDMHAVLADLTCDSDGKIDSFINPKGGEPLKSLPLHSFNGQQPYRVAMLLTGVYQETMGSNHNMFGSLNSATIRIRNTTSTVGGIPPVASSMSLCSENGCPTTTTTTAAPLDSINAADALTTFNQQHFVVENAVPGESVATVLSRAGHNADDMLRVLRGMASDAVACGRASAAEAEAAMECVGQRMGGYTYMR